MKQLGNLALICAKRKDTLLQMTAGTVVVHLGTMPKLSTLSASWDDDEAILAIIHELNFGKYREGVA